MAVDAAGAAPQVQTPTTTGAAKTTPATTNAAAAAKGTTEAASTGLAETFDQFLTLLTTQIKNQDPLSPLDSNEMTAQLVSFAGVEQQINANRRLDQLISGMNNSAAAASLGYMGRQIESPGNTVVLTKGVGTMIYELPEDVSTVQLELRDANKNLVNSFQSMQTKQGLYRLEWDGKTASGAQAPDGSYTLTVIATNAKGTAVSTSTRSTGVVTGVDMSGSTTMLNLGKTKIAADQILAVH